MGLIGLLVGDRPSSSPLFAHRHGRDAEDETVAEFLGRGALRAALATRPERALAPTASLAGEVPARRTGRDRSMPRAADWLGARPAPEGGASGRATSRPGPASTLRAPPWRPGPSPRGRALSPGLGFWLGPWPSSSTMSLARWSCASPEATAASMQRRAWSSITRRFTALSGELMAAVCIGTSTQ